MRADSEQSVMALALHPFVGQGGDPVADAEGDHPEASMRRIAAAAGVSIKTVYRHFDGKGDLVSAVMLNACALPWPDDLHDHTRNGTKPPDLPWYADSQPVALPIDSADYLRSVLSPTELSPYHVVTRDAPRFPELGRRYGEVAECRASLLVRYVDRWTPSQDWKIADTRRAAGVFIGMIGGDQFDEVAPRPTDQDIADCAQAATHQFLALLDAGLM